MFMRRFVKDPSQHLLIDTGEPRKTCVEVGTDDDMAHAHSMLDTCGYIYS